MFSVQRAVELCVWATIAYRPLDKLANCETVHSQTAATASETHLAEDVSMEVPPTGLPHKDGVLANALGVSIDKALAGCMRGRGLLYCKKMFGAGMHTQCTVAWGPPGCKNIVIAFRGTVTTEDVKKDLRVRCRFLWTCLQAEWL